MVILYVNNFRGFSKTFIKLTDVNFLLGENSTGKTSILSLINIISNQKFWFSQEFNTDEVELGYFSEIISANAAEPFFEIGLLDCTQKSKNTVKAFYMKFIEEEGSPFLSNYKFLIDDKSILLVKDEKNVKYGFEAFKLSKKQDDYLESFTQWINSSNSHSVNKLTEIKIDEVVPLPFLQSVVLNDIKSNKNNKISVDKNSVPLFLNNLTWIAPIRAKPKRNYDGYKISFSSEGDHIPYILKNLLQNGEKDNTQDVKKGLEKFGLDSNLFEKISVKTLGNDKTSPFEINITLNETPLKITNVGYGVSQILPIIVEILARRNNTCFAIQQPEVHIHPKGQAALGELFFHTAQQDGKTFIIETHSDFIVDRYRLALRKSNKQTKEMPSNAQVLFFERTNNGNVIHTIAIDERGDYSENQPKAFKEFFIKEELDMLTY